ncbi:MAG TPA: ATP-binding protein [Terracidiphilus sp.]|nr:ATP-binding protein [Terracidiphilus sp.]
MSRLTIQARLTAWYFLSLAVIVALFASASWFAMRASMYHSIDRDLGYRMTSVLPFIQSNALNSPEQFDRVFAGSADSPIVGIFAQITDDEGNILYESNVLRSHRVPVFAAAPPDGAILLSTVGERGWPVRVASLHIEVNGVELNVHVVEPLRDLMSSLREYRIDLALLTVVALLLTTTAGYWMSRRALAPVEQIRRQAEAIDPANLTARLYVPPTEDELARLAQTLNAMLERIETSFHSVRQFTADASHELRAPLALILTAGEVSLRRERTREELTDVLQKVVREARHMSNLVDNLLDLARGDVGGRHTQIQPIEICSTLRTLAAELEPTATAKGLELTVKLPANEVHVLSDATDLRRLFLILLDNAIKYTESGAIRISLAVDGTDASISIADTGIGMDESALPHIFDRFWRADKVRSRAEGGAGLGLSLAAQILERLNGSIAVQSAPGKGSTFTVRLPLASEPQNI